MKLKNTVKSVQGTSTPTKRKPSDAAAVVAKIIAADLRDPNHYYLWTDIQAWAQITPLPAMVTPQAYKTQQFWLLQFREDLVEQVGALTGRLLHSVPGVGYSLLAAKDGTDYIESKVSCAIRRTVRKGQNLLTLVRDTDLDAGGKQRKKLLYAKLDELAAVAQDFQREVRVTAKANPKANPKTEPKAYSKRD